MQRAIILRSAVILLEAIFLGCSPSPSPSNARPPSNQPSPISASPTRPVTQPTPVNEPGAQNLEIVKTIIMQCRTDVNSSSLSSDYVAAWEVRNRMKDSWPSVQGSVNLFGSGGLLVSSQNIEDSYIAPDTIDWIVSKGLLGQYSSPISGGGSKIQDIKLNLARVQWTRVDDSIGKYKYDVTFAGSQNGSGSYPSRSFAVVVTNNSDFAMMEAGVFGIFFDTRGTPVDIAKSYAMQSADELTIPYSQSKRFDAISVADMYASDTRRCLGPRDPSGYTLDYFVSFRTYSGQTVTRFFTAKVP